MIMISNFLFNFTNFCVIVFFLTKLPRLGILLSTEVRAVAVAKLVILGVSPLTSFILALREALVAKLVILGISSLTFLRVVLLTKLVISGILSPIFFILALYTSYTLYTSIYIIVSLNLLKSTGTGTNLSTSNLSTLFSKLLKLVGTFFSLSISKSTFLANSDVSTPVAFLNLFLLHN